MNFTIETEKDKIILKLTLPKPVRNIETLVTENRIVVRDQSAFDYLQKNNIKVGSMLKSGKNDNLNPPYQSQWEFEKYKEKPSKKDKKINISLDNSSKPVVSSRKSKSRKKTTTSYDLNETK